MDFNEKLQELRDQVEAGIRHLVPPDASTPARLEAAMNHSLRAGGKRVRPALLLAMFEMNPSEMDPIPAAVALECLHTYSLIHDDLPCMDDSELRRGNPTCHVAFDEATAVLAGDGLLTLAFEILSCSYEQKPEVANRLVLELSRAAGAAKMVGGQMLDTMLEHQDENKVAIETVFDIEDRKTGALFSASLRMGLILTDASEAHLEIGSRLGLTIGRIFQIVDDILDATGDEATVGKTLQTDDRNQKTTAVTHYGIDGARAEVDKLYEKALLDVEHLGKDTHFLQSLLTYLKNRVY